MKRIIIYIQLIFVIFTLIECTDINDIHDEYLKNGETIYIAKVDSADAFSGNKRIMLRLYTGNPQISTFAIFWNERTDSLIVPIENRISPDSVDVMIGDETRIMQEKSYVFEIYSRDKNRHRSIKYEQLGEVYGDAYQSTLQNHHYKSAIFDAKDSTLNIIWYSSIDKTEIGVEFNYTDKKTGLPISQEIGVSKLTTTKILDIDIDYPVSYRTFFLPEPDAIDTFYTEFLPIELVEVKNVALNKPVKVSDVLGTNEGRFAVDGSINTSRWVTNPTGEHWIEIDLGGEYNIFSFATWSGANGSYGNPIPSFKFQIDVGGLWLDIVTVTGNTNPQYSIEFGPVKASKVRYFVPSNTDNTRLYEIAVYTKMKVGH